MMMSKQSLAVSLLLVVAWTPCSLASSGLDGSGFNRGNFGAGVPPGEEEGTDNGGVALPPIYPIIDQSSVQLAALITNIIVGMFFGLREFADSQGLIESYKVTNIDLNDTSVT